MQQHADAVTGDDLSVTADDLARGEPRETVAAAQDGERREGIEPSGRGPELPATPVEHSNDVGSDPFAQVLEPLPTDRHPIAGGARVVYLEDVDGFEVELVATAD